ncbi:MAG: amino acid permease [Caldilineaceae bacterium]|nr:amino acid permease [Caldilineaceae bacterium]
MTVQPAASPVGVPEQKGRFGTFAGVFTPNVLTILGLILFLRTGWVVGQAGLVGALVIVALANAITLLTGLSLSAIATSMRVRTGGNYYLISRSLGLEIGGAIGIPLYLSQAISVAFYVIGFTEALLSIPFFQTMDARLISTAVVVLFGVIAYIGADFALRIQYVVLAALVGALISFFAGGWGDTLAPTLTPAFTPGVTFWAVFAVFFPAVTGITVGASMSGDLKDPGKSIPRGTLASIVVTAAIYLATVIWLALHASPSDLIANNLIMQEIAAWPLLILIGVWAATLSSALGSVMAAPRVLQALAFDNVLPRVLGARMGSKTEPRVAVLVTTALAVAVVWMGDLNFVAPVISMFFLNTYGMTNLAASIEKLVGNPSYRPRFNIHWSVSLLGALGCYGAMFLINAPATVVAIVISYGIFFLLERRSLQRTWGDLRSGLWFTLARYSLLNLESTRFHAKNWRPNILVFTGQPHNREQLVALADWLVRGHGIVTFTQLLIGDVGQIVESNLREAARKRIRAYIQDRRMLAFAEVDIAPDFYTGALTVAQSHGVGGLEPNTVLLGWSRTPEGRTRQIELMHALAGLGKSVLFLRYDGERGYGKRRVIDVWWGGRGGNADLMLLLAYIISQHRSWADANIRLLRIIDGEEGRAGTLAHMQATLDAVRVLATPVVIVRGADQSTQEVISTWSQESDLSLLGLRIPAHLEDAEYSRRVDRLMAQMGSVLLVRSAQNEDILDVDQ